ncbi:hypothetical protein FS837_000409 [Tulasnella sp. UAMH 9824]|nr:hypothetical protein FS837_000409 [Tulasnella sp. UAMH 9824]
MTTARFISPFMTTGNIDEYLRTSPGSVSDDVRLKLLRDVLNGLVYLHSLNPPICHADIKLENILITDLLEAVLCDFGLARLADEQPSGLTTTQTIKGSIRYMSPELLKENGAHALHSDIWAYGCLVLKVMTGSLPYAEASTDTQVLLALALHDLPAKLTDPKFQDNGLNPLLTKCWDLDPSARPPASECLLHLPGPGTAGPSLLESRTDAPPSIPVIDFADDEEEAPAPPVRSTPRKPSVTITSAPTISVEVADDTAPTTPSGPSAVTSSAANGRPSAQPARSGPPPIYRKGSLRCAGCDLLIVGKIVSAMDRRWHPACFKCSECSELLEHVSSYEHNGKPYCHLDYHGLFMPKCYHCKRAIADERFTTVNDPGLDGGDTRYYHELHFFCAECGDPFLHPSASSAAPKGQKPRPHEAHHNDLGYTVYRGYAYCEACLVRLRMPKCTGCKKSIRDEVVEALGGKWHFHCFVCKSCKRPFEDPSYFQRGDDPYCDNCYSILIKSELWLG